LREKLYWTISKFSIRSLFYDYFVFFDTTPYLADQLFIRHEVRVWFDREYAKDGSRNLLSCQEEGCTEVSCSLGGFEEKHDPVWASALRRRNQFLYGRNGKDERSVARR